VCSVLPPLPRGTAAGGRTLLEYLDSSNLLPLSVLGTMFGALGCLQRAPRERVTLPSSFVPAQAPVCVLILSTTVFQHFLKIHNYFPRGFCRQPGSQPKPWVTVPEAGRRDVAGARHGAQRCAAPSLPRVALRLRAKQQALALFRERLRGFACE